MATLRFTDDDRDTDGFVRAASPSPTTEASAPQPPAAPAPRASRATPPARPALSAQARYQLAMAGACVAGLILVLLTMRSSASPIAQSPAALAIATVVPQATPAASPTLPPTAPPVAMLPAYGAPNEAPRWQIEATRAITPTAHYGADWIQADVQGSGRIWLRASDFPQLAIVGPDLAPRPAPAAADAPMPAWQAPIVVELPSPQDIAQALTIPASAHQSKPADDRAARHAEAVAREQESHDNGHGSK